MYSTSGVGLRECSESSGLRFLPCLLLHELVPLASSSDKLDIVFAVAKALLPGAEDVQFGG